MASAMSMPRSSRRRDVPPAASNLAHSLGPRPRDDASAGGVPIPGLDYSQIARFDRSAMWPRSCTASRNFTGMLTMDRRHASPRKHPLATPATGRKPRLHRELLKPLSAGGGAGDSPRHALTAKCVTFNAGAIRGKNAA